ncbi:MAG TPA: formylglycine-generating enzyme family protein [Verrucomicrobiota bacterium]|nr:formylglycine-generating enzyme family protein [Verrucomicrobiota bacterium]HNU53025.1 formylglycine-generating enzyme family protein [Verrucomicrobiota bacterium]
MKTEKRVSAVAVIGAMMSLMSSQSQAQLPVIESLSLNGELICAGLQPGSTATVEWAPTVNGPWTNSWAGLDAVVVGTDGTIRVQVPMFYRVLGEPEQTGPAGMVWIPPGTFTMGSPPSERNRYSDEGPQTVVTISKGFWLGKYEVTQREYAWVMGNNPSRFTGDLDRPVEQVTWYEAVEYCNRLTAQERAAGRLPVGYEYRLPTEAQWEYACRAGTTTRYSFGDALECDDECGACPVADQYMWWCGNSGDQTHRVGQKLPNPWGLYDMHGNVWEWCADWLQDSLPGGSVTDPTGPSSGSDRVARGGSWYYNGRSCRSANRYDGWPESGIGNLGVRAALVAVP